MISNDVLRRIRYTFDLSDSNMITVFGLTNYAVTREQICNWLKKDDDPTFELCSDVTLATFLNGFIIEKRGKKDGPQPKPESRITNNIVFMKLKIALNLKSDDVLLLVRQGGFHLSKHELSSFFRKPGHKNYRECKDQVLRYFLKGLQMRYRDSETI